MYEAPAFLEDDPAVLRAHLDAHPFAVLAVETGSGPVVDQLPMLLDERDGKTGRLIGHVARANPFWRGFASGRACAVFGGPHAYVSPDWYASKAEDPRVVPTWNYATLHVEGELRAFDDGDRILEVVSRLTGRFEGRRDHPWKVTDAPADFVERFLRGVVGLELEIDRMVGKYKLSQNRSAADRAGVVAGLRREGDPNGRALGDLMAAREPATGSVGTHDSE